MSFAVVTPVYKEGKVRKRHTQVSVMQMIAESILFGILTGMERIFLNFFFLYGFGFDSEVKKSKLLFSIQRTLHSIKHFGKECISFIQRLSRFCAFVRNSEGRLGW